MDEQKRVDNGVDGAFMLAAREQFTQIPEAAQFTFRATTRWLHGTHSRSDVLGFFGLGSEQEHRTTFTLDCDHPEVFRSEDNGATPLEVALAALGSCINASMASIAQRREIQLRSAVATITGSIHFHGIFGIDEEVRNGFENIKVSYAIDADASHDDIEALLAQAQKRSAVFDLLSNPTNIQVELI